MMNYYKDQRDNKIGSYLAGIIISRKMVIAIRAGGIKANEPKILKGIWWKSCAH